MQRINKDKRELTKKPDDGKSKNNMEKMVGLTGQPLYKNKFFYQKTMPIAKTIQKRRL